MNLEDVRILLVEDNPIDARLLREMVREGGAGRLHLEHVGLLAEALDFLSQQQFDVVLLDLSLPDARGLETVTSVHAHSPKVPIVVLTSLDDEAIGVRAVRAGAQDYLIKGRVGGDLLVRSVRYACERARAVEALERREEHYRSLTENSLDLVSILNLDGTIRYVSPSHERILGYTVEELVGANAFAFLHPEDVARVRAAVRQNTGTEALEYRFRHLDGSYRTLESYGRNLSHLAGVGGVVVNSRDVTERRRLEEQLRHSQRIEAMGRLAGGVAHDFNNLLMVIAGHSQMLLDSMLPGDPARDDLEQVVKATQRATDLTRQLLAFSRRQAVKPAFLNLNLMVQHSERMLKRVLGENVQLIANLAPDVQSIYADPGQLEQVILNLALNARDAMPQGGTLTLATKNATLGEANAGRYVLLEISDTGSGIASQVLPHVFEPFFTTKEHGTGLGLSTSYGIIKQAGGEIEVDSQTGAGTTFRIYLPAAEKTAEQPEPLPQSAPLSGTETILLVEDEDGVRRVLETMLKRSGYRVLSSGSTSEAVTIARDHGGTIHLLITDMVMPGMSGLNMADQLTAQRPEMRVLFVSGHGDQVSPAADAAFLQKPFSTAELALKVREVLQAAP
ncbi:MAG TPA: response regulator [Bryobacteraceae bacterium]|nr:response regulator [Bryobacteraceae bacterium]